jgi:hypothetical protein
MVAAAQGGGLDFLRSTAASGNSGAPKAASLGDAFDQGGLDVANAAKQISFAPAQVRAGERRARDCCRVSSSFRQILLRSGGQGQQAALCSADAAARLRTSKESGLREFQQRGWILVDATYEPVNALGGEHERDRVIRRDYRLLRDDLAAVLSGRPIPIILVKANICRLLGHELIRDGFNVLNNGRVVYFPSNGRQNDFQRQFGAILRSASKRGKAITKPASKSGFH